MVKEKQQLGSGASRSLAICSAAVAPVAATASALRPLGVPRSSTTPTAWRACFTGWCSGEQRWLELCWVNPLTVED
jgi:hypothetical protein